MNPSLSLPIGMQSIAREYGTLIAWRVPHRRRKYPDCRFQRLYAPPPHTCRRSTPTAQLIREVLRAQSWVGLQTAIQLLSHLCDNSPHVRHQPRIHFPASRPRRADAAVVSCALERPEPGSGSSQAHPKLLIGKVIDLHSKYHHAVRRQAVVRERFGQVWRR